MALRSTYTATLNGGPKVLLWGDAAGMRALSDFLRKMLIVPRAMTLGEFCEAVDGKTITVRMRANRRDTGMRLNHEGWGGHCARNQPTISRHWSRPSPRQESPGTNI
jgi:hypothetical protein